VTTTLDRTGQTPEREALLDLYRQMLLIRRFEERVMEMYARALIPGIAHVSIGQEAVPVGICTALRIDDYVTSTHRGHGHCLAKGARPDGMFAELLGKAPGYCGGKGGSMHIADPETGNLGANAIVGGSFAIATGAALSAQTRGTDQVVACFFGDGAANQGLFLESMNMAAIWSLPVLFVCENNQYCEYTATSDVTAGDVAARGTALGLTASAVDGMDVCEVREAATAAVGRARAGDGPTLLVCETYRYFGHGMSDPDRPYRTRDEEETWKGRDPLERLAATMRQGFKLDPQDTDVQAEIEAELDAAVAFASSAPYPEPEEVRAHVFARSGS
jgi:acetoin:2,6-dichlorophenolindophenol oxidoreductase subunit alpha